MGCTVRDKHIRAVRRSRSVKPETDRSNTNTATTTAVVNNDNGVKGEPVMESGLVPLNCQLGLSGGSSQIPDLNAIPDGGPSSVFEDSGWGYCTEEQLEEILWKNLEFLYNEAIAKLVALGYDEDVALKAILSNGHCYGGMDVLTNILQNSLAYLNSGGCGSNEDSEESEPVFTNLRQLEEYSLAGMVCLLQQIKPHLSRGDAMWCLLMSDLHVVRASMMEIPVLPSTGTGACGGSGSVTNGGIVDGSGHDPIGVSPDLCRFHGGWGFGNGGTSEFPSTGLFSNTSEVSLQKEIECPKRFNLTPSLKTLLKRNVAMFAAGFRANARQLQSQQQASFSPGDSSGSSSMGDKPVSIPVIHPDEPQIMKNQDVNSVLSKFRDLNLDENIEHIPLDQKDEMILNLVHQIKDLDKQVKDRKEWAHQKAMQAARKLSHDLTELKILRIEREENQRLKKGKQTFEDTTIKRLSEMENALRKASGQVDRANAAVRKLENENAEIRAEMEASKLSASESLTMCLEVAKREKKYLKKLMVWEKQKAKLQEDIASEKQKIANKKQQLADVEAAQKEFEAKWRQEQKAKELALAQLEEQRRLKEAIEADSKRRLESLRLKIEIDFQRQKDDHQRLEQELTRLKSSTTKINQLQQHESNRSTTRNPKSANSQVESIEKLLQEFEKLDTTSSGSYNRECIVCNEEEVSVVFLPCAHQLMCVKCNEDYLKKGGRQVCPSCRVPIERRIRVFGASS